MLRQVEKFKNKKRKRNNIRNNKNNILKISYIILQHVNNNLKEYIIAIIILFIGVFLGVVLINNIQEKNQIVVQEYINKFIQALKTEYQINKLALLKEVLSRNIIIAVIIWFAGSTIVGLPLIYFILGYKGFSIGYTISSIIATLGTTKGILMASICILPQNILYLPVLLAFVVSGMKVYKVIIKDRQLCILKNEIIRHTIFSICLTIILCLISFIETYFSVTVLEILINYL